MRILVVVSRDLSEFDELNINSFAREAFDTKVFQHIEAEADDIRVFSISEELFSEHVFLSNVVEVEEDIRSVLI